MSLSKAAPNCVFCGMGKGIYSCPRCNQRYCSSNCYKCQGHAECSESFFKEWVEQSLREKSSNRSEKENMLRLLKKIEEEYTEDSTELPIEDRFVGINIHDADENVIWQNLSDEEKKRFNAIIDDERKLAAIVPVKQPWWTNITLNLVEDADAESPNLEDGTTRPPYPLNLKKLSDLTSFEPSNCIKYNLINILYPYTFLYRFYNSDLRDFREDIVDHLLIFSPVLSEGKNYFSLEEVVQDSIRMISNSELDSQLTFVKSVINDVANIMHGPSNAKPATFVLCALHDIKLLFLEQKYANRDQEDKDRSIRKKLLFAVKKIEYFMSWCLDFENVLSEIASQAVLLLLPEILPDTKGFPQESEENKNIKKPLIEELD